MQPKANSNADASSLESYADIGAAGVALTYARALLGATEAAHQTEAVLGELDSIVADVLDPLPQLDAVLSSGLVAADEKSRLMERAFKGRASDLLLNFLNVVAQHGRLAILRQIRSQARRLYGQMQGRVRVEVRTAAPLDEQLSGRIAEQLRQLLGAQPQLEQVVDPRLIGGLVLRVGDTVLDGSVATRLAGVREQMINRSVHEIQRGRDRFSTAARD
ncbi:MAG TPA: ATP synthase F1 subunit delta [Pirellulales bacterium]|jgi:F-type H+-transporting ATPase subunit delta|nr:ATP synthase F1 subunit delta [Pirellulales bacterium]